ncbi:hypothetical protein HOK021_50150 [Streptomyces hygroscopicus]|nr:hypothetical protein HOK021_50150 [Streptomyces hygroscopicus]
MVSPEGTAGLRADEPRESVCTAICLYYGPPVPRSVCTAVPLYRRPPVSRPLRTAAPPYRGPRMTVRVGKIRRRQRRGGRPDRSGGANPLSGPGADRLSARAPGHKTRWYDDEP